MPNILRAAVVQTSSVYFNTPKTLARLASLAAEAKSKGAQLVVFPEGFIGGYPRGSIFGTYLGNRQESGRDEFKRYFNAAIAVPGPEIKELERIASENNLFLVVGVIERGGSTLYCTIVYVDPVDGYLAKHRKLMPTATERILWGMGDGSTMPVLEIEFIKEQAHPVTAKIGGAICWENYMPLLRYFLYSKGTQIYCAPTADGRDRWVQSMQHIATEGRCFVLGCNQFNRQSDFPEDHPIIDGDPHNPDHIMSSGGSVIVSPLGEILAGPLRGEQGILVADLDLDEIVRAKFEFDVVGHYSRPDVFTLEVNEKPHENVRSK
ncbi:uncharacterized protein VTP21DRAFT_2313 [Calcarisporiella thermophila]|uniref:uncharacterized protein n=1 Tax=Calcarisporiella thermophila TaxID=911321 RepID=UPI0037442364